MRCFREVLEECDLREIHLKNRKFTWSNQRQNPTQAKLDHVFGNEEWDTSFSNHVLHALSTSLSNHCPLLLSNQIGPRRPSSFKFENFWIKLPRFREVVTAAWNETTLHHEPFHKLYHKLQSTAKALRVWSKRLIPDAKLQLHMALEVILRLDEAQEFRQLSPEEQTLRKRLKLRVQGVAVIERARRSQAARLRELKFGDANTKFFHRRINARRRKNFIQRLKKRDTEWATTHEEKAAELQSHFLQAMQRPPTRRTDFNWDLFGIHPHDLSVLDDPFSE